MANPINQAVALYELLKTCREVAGEKWMEDGDKISLVRDLIKSVPPHAMCGQCTASYTIITRIMDNILEGLIDAGATRAPVPTIVAEEVHKAPTAPKAQAKKPGKAAVRRGKK